MLNFNFGNKRPDQKQIVLVSVVLSVLVASLSQCTGASSESLWDLLDEVQRRFFPQTIINDVLLKNPGVIDRRVERDVDKAIRDYERLTGYSNEPRIPLPRLIEKAPDESLCYTEECKKLGGEMRLCAPWVKNCI
jgi:hypothetical protein